MWGFYFLLTLTLDCCDGSDEYNTQITCPYKCKGDPQKDMEVKSGEIEDMNSLGKYPFPLTFPNITKSALTFMQ